jgi:molecular chaperone HtpG
VVHNKVEGSLNHTSLLFVPSVQPFDLFEPERKSHVKLYVNRVFISATTKDLIPAYLRFLRGVVDSQDLSLNVSREMLQTDPKLAKIRTQVAKKVLSELKKKATKAPEDYATFWGNFGAVLKEGLVEDPALRDRILEVCRFASTGADGLTSLAAYVERMKDGQEAIFYIAADDPAKLGQSPHLEGFKAKGVEVLLLSDHVDEFWLQHITEFEGKPFKSITRGAADLDDIKADEKDDEEKVDEADLSALIAAIKVELGETVKDVRPSKRLTDSPVCLIADEGDMDVNLERLLKRHGQLDHVAPRVLELNPTHAIITNLAERAKSDGANNDDLLKDAAHLLLDQARIFEGETPAKPSEFARRLGSVMAQAFAV